MTKLTFKRIASAFLRRIRHQLVLVPSKRNSRKSIDHSTGKNILVLCYGNIYRSPLVEYLLKKSVLFGAFSIKSAGFYEKPGRSCERQYLSLLKDRGYDLSNHRSTVVRKDDLDWANIIIIMDRKNWDLVGAVDRVALQKVVWVGAFNRSGSVEVDDPYGKGVEGTKHIICQLENCVVNIAAVLRGEVELSVNIVRDEKQK